MIVMIELILIAIALLSWMFVMLAICGVIGVARWWIKRLDSDDDTKKVSA